ncbi:MAG TPA: hypothetical protein VMG32_03945 [Anaeromyxobacteraceae bacterium]|nr:hypothetical protein [Anaeromyxobacteraceae bacterium]
MRATVLKELARARPAGRFVWLSIDTEKPKNAAFLERFPVEVWPTFLVLEAGGEQAVLKWTGSASRDELLALLADGERRARAGPALALARADAALAAGKKEEALGAYREALSLGGPRWEKRPRVVLSLVLALSTGGTSEACAATAAEEAKSLPRDSAFADVVGTGLGCAVEDLPLSPARALAARALEPLVREALRLQGLLADDRSGLYQALVESLRARGDEEGARAVARSWWAFLEQDGRRARTSEARASLDSARVLSAMSLGDPARALPALDRSARELPWDYNPPARRARVLLELGRLDEAGAAAREALLKGYGPVKLRLYQLLARVLSARGDLAGEGAALDEAIEYAAGLPPAQQREGVLAELKARRAALLGERRAEEEPAR